MGKLGVYWHDHHRGPEGGFCLDERLEAVAVVMRFGIDDREFRNARNYPRDLVHPS